MSFTYAFGRMGRHARKIHGEADAFVRMTFSNLHTPIRDLVYAHHFAIRSVLFQIFYSEKTDVLYAMHAKYANRLLDISGQGLLQLWGAYHCAIAAGITPKPTDEERTRTLYLLELVGFLYDVRSASMQNWCNVISQGDSMIAAAHCSELAGIFQMAPSDWTAFAKDWLSLVPRIHISTNSLFASSGWAQTVAGAIGQGRSSDLRSEVPAKESKKRRCGFGYGNAGARR